jgi:hypothetical protein
MTGIEIDKQVIGLTDFDKDLNDSRRIQLRVLQQRIGLHGTRMWQLPLTYLATIAGSVSLISQSNDMVPLKYLFIVLLILGVFLTGCLFGADEGYSRTAKNMNTIERLLGLEEFTRNRKSHRWPYWALMLLGLAICGFGVLFNPNN